MSALRFAAVVAAVALSAGALFAPVGGEGRRVASASAEDALSAARLRVAEAERQHGPHALETAAALARLEAALQASPDLHLAEGTECARRVVAIREALPGSQAPELASSLESLAIWLWHARDYAAEEPFVERALALREREEPPNDAGIGLDLHLLSDLRRIEGDYGRALELRDRSATYFERCCGPVNVHSGVNYHYRAVILAAIGDLAGAATSAQKAVDIRARLLPGGEADLARSLNLLGGLLVDSGELARAEPVLERARSLWEEYGRSDRTDAALAMAALGRLFAARHDWDRAADLLTQAVAIRVAAFGPDHPLVASTVSRLGAIERRRGHLAEARSLLRRALDVQDGGPRSSYPEWASTLREQALLDAEDGRLEAALEGALASERMTREYVRASALGLSEREALAQTRTRVGGLDVAWESAVRLSDRGALDDRASSALLDEAIRSRALVLDTLVARRQVLALHQDDATTAGVEALAREERRLSRLVLDGDGPAELIARAEVEVNRAERNLAEMSRAYREVRERERPGLPEVRAALPVRTALVSYFRSASDYVASVLVAGRSMPRIVPLGDAAEIDRDVSAWHASVSRDPRLSGSGGDEAAYRRVARRLAERVWDPVATRLDGVDRIFVVPDGSLQQVNFATLVSADGEYLVASGPSFHTLSAERDLVGERRLGTQPTALLAIGDPAYGVLERSSRHAFDPLPASRSEASEVASLWTGGEATVLIGAEATEAAFKRLAPGARVLHIATHAFFEGGAAARENPLLLAGLAMAGANESATGSTPDGEDGILTAGEVALLDLQGVDWAVLSACATGAGVVEPGEGVLGLRRAFRIAGARTLVVSLWPVEDDATRYWMRALYASRRGGASTVDAVRTAALVALDEERRSIGTSHPYFWGGFISIGDWR